MKGFKFYIALHTVYAIIFSTYRLNYIYIESRYYHLIRFHLSEYSKILFEKVTKHYYIYKQ